MSNLFKYTKRVLTSVLAAAVVLTAIPSTAFGAELPDEDFVEAVEVQEAEVADEAAVEEEAAATDGTGNEEVFIEGEEEEPDKAFADVTVKFTVGSNLKVLNMSALDEGVGHDWATSTSLGATVNVDSTLNEGFTFVVAPNTASGYQVADGFIDFDAHKSSYLNLSGLVYNEDVPAWKDSEGATVADPWHDDNYVVDASASDFTISDYAPVTGYKVVTIKKSLLTAVLNGYTTKDGKYAPVADGTGTANDRPVLDINIKNASKGKFEIPMPTVKDNKAELVNLVPADRTIEYGAAAANSKLELSLVPPTTYSLANSKITIDLVKDSKSQKLGDVQFPVTIDKSDATYFGSAIAASAVDADHPIAFNTTSGNLFILNDMVQAAYKDKMAGGNMTIKVTVDVTTPVAETWKVDVINDVTGAKYNKDLETNTMTVMGNDASTAMVTSAKKGVDDVKITVTGKEDASGAKRAVSRVYYTLGTDTTEHDLVGTKTSRATDGAPGTKTVGQASITDDITFHVETTESVSVAAASDFVLYDENGNKITNSTRLVSGSTLKFKIGSAAARKPVDKVSYSIGGSQKSADLKPVDGFYTIDNVNDALEIGVTAKTLGSNVSVIKPDISTIIKDAVDPAKIISKDADTTSAAAATTGYNAAVKNEPYYFTVQPTAKNIITKVEYSFGDATTKSPATFVSGDIYNATSGVKTSLWRIDKVTDKTTIHVTEVPAVMIKSDGLSKAVITVETASGDKTLDTTGFPVPKDQNLDFTVSGDTAKGINATSVAWYQESGAAPTAPYSNTIAEASKDFMIPKATLATAYTADKAVIIVTTSEEIVDKSTYAVEFKNGNKDNSKATDLATDALQNTYNADGTQITGQAITLAINEKSDLGHTGHLPVIHKTSKYSDTFGYDSATYSVGKYNTTDKVVTGTFSGTPKNILAGDDMTGYKAGSDTITLTAKKNGYDGKTNNTGIYTGELPLTVVNQFTGLEIKATSDAISRSGVVKSKLSVYGTNGRTGVSGEQTLSKDTPSNPGISKIAWSFVPDISRDTEKAYDFMNCTDGVTPLGTGKISAVDGSSIDTGADTDARYYAVNVAAAFPDESVKSVTVQAVVYDESNAVIATLTKTLSIVEDTSFVVLPTLTVKNGKTLDDTYIIAPDATDEDAMHVIETDLTGSNTATIAHKVYEIIDSSDAKYLAWIADPYDEKLTKAAVDAGAIAELTTGVTWKSEIARLTSDTSVWTATYTKEKDIKDYATLSGGTNGTFTVTAGTKRTNFEAGATFDVISVKVWPVVDGIDYKASEATTAAFRVVDNVAKHNLTFMLNGVEYAEDGKYVDADGTPNATTTTRTDGKVVVRMLDKSKYLKDYTHSEKEIFAKGITEGVVIMNTPEGMSYKLPTSADFTSANEDKRSILAAWVNNNGVAELPGADVTVSDDSDDNVWTAIWVPRYVIDKDVVDAEFFGGTSTTTAPQVANGVVPTDKDKTDPFDPTGKTKYDVYKTKVGRAAYQSVAPVKLFAQKFNKYDTSAKKPVYSDYNPTTFALGWADGTYDKYLEFPTATSIKGISVGTETHVVATLTDNGTTWKVASDSIAVAYKANMLAAFENVPATTVKQDDDNNYYIDGALTEITLQKSQSAATLTAVLASGNPAPVKANLSSISDLDKKLKFDFKLATGGDNYVKMVSLIHLKVQRQQ